MGLFRIEIEAVGGHGCDRHIKDGSKVDGCRFMSCPDCLARELVAAYQRKGMDVQKATLTHWPGQSGEVQDDLLTKVRKGSF